MISGCIHYLEDGRPCVWGPLQRELERVATLFECVEVFAPLSKEPAPRAAVPYACGNIRLVSLKVAGGPGLRGKLSSLVAAPGFASAVLRAVGRSDLIHVRCPCNVGLVACLLLSVLRGQPRWAKYAGNWRPHGSDPLSYKLQRFLLRSGLFGGPVTVNGRWPRQPAHVYSFLNPCFDAEELEEARAATAGKSLSLPVMLLFSGVLHEEKGILVSVRVAAEVRRRGIPVHLDVVGGGPAETKARELARDLNVEKLVAFHGWRARSELPAFYRRAHFVILPSLSEGWPKVLSEGMAYRAVPIAHAVSCIEQVFADAGAGIALRTLDAAAYADVIEAFTRAPETWEGMAARGQQAAQAFTYEVYVERLAHVLRQAYPHLNLQLPHRRATRRQA